jgi:hypothetical protein
MDGGHSAFASDGAINAILDQRSLGLAAATVGVARDFRSGHTLAATCSGDNITRPTTDHDRDPATSSDTTTGG